MKTTELFVEQTLTGLLILAAGAAPFLSWEKLEKLPGEAKGGIDISSAAGAIGIAYLLGVIFDRFADTLLERINRWNRLLFAIANAPTTPCTRFQPRVLVRVGQRRRAGTLHPARVVNPRSRRMRRAQTRQRVPA
jgi:hypothetical protein